MGSSTASKQPSPGSTQTQPIGNAEQDFKTFLQTFKTTANLTSKQALAFQNTTLDDVKDTIATIQQKQISSGRQQWIRRLEPFLASMEQYGKVIETFLNVSEALAFIWIASNFSEALSSLLDAYFEFGELIPQLSAYQAHCVSNEYMRTVLALIYKDILEFHACAMKHFRKSMWKQMFQAVWRGFTLKLEELKDNMRRHRHLVESQASIVVFEETQALRKLAETNFQHIQNEYLRHRLREVLRWLNPYNSESQHETCVKAKFPKSGEWLVRDIGFKNWVDPLYCTTPLLWLNGIPGAGMFLFAKLVVQCLYGMPTRQELLEQIQPDHFPKEIGSLYDTILSRVLGENAGAPSNTVLRFLGLLAVAKRPLRWHEIQGYFVFDPEEDEQIDHDLRKLRLDPKDLCWSLVEHQEDDSVELVHPTAKEHLIRTKYLQPSKIEYHLAQTCLQFMSIDACGRNQDQQDIKQNLMKGYYSFLDYAVACWSLHLHSALPGLSSGTDTNELGEDLVAFLDFHRSESPTKLTVPASILAKIKAFKEHNFFDELAQAVVSARKQLGHDGTGPSLNDPLDLGQVTKDVRETFEKVVPQVSDNSELALVRAYYGKNSDWFKCHRINCVRFYMGFSKDAERNLHVAKHERPYRCADTSCSMYTFGYGTEKALQKHMFDVHGADPGSNMAVEFPAPPREVRNTTQGHIPCPDCPKMFTRRSILRTHLRTHENDKPFRCGTCNKAFTRLSDCKRHEAIHAGDRKYMCAGLLEDGTAWGCNAGFTRADKLQDHLRSAIGRKCIAARMGEMERARELPTATPTVSMNGRETEEAILKELFSSLVDIVKAWP
ncbi:hypothetical protein G7Z17_g3062 [Cylindrodendrum hubeiense]|uniref:C2H2-type domain-containing protein n=1 Tax=Cylindrodendrum hubeiense TaxID=595255 RepID=A0A9P5HIK7_9HYPO|nr:hypothetical protein G7Z17_g3062 [Cylindrodendrum hubeiense]